MRRLLVVGAVLAGLVGLRAAAAAEAIGEYVKDEKWGYKVRTPREWTQVAMSASEQWIAGKHIAPRALAAKKTSGGYLERPEMWVIAFPKARQKTAGDKAELGKDEAGEDTVTITVKNPYKDYKEFVKEMGLAGGGYHFSKEDPGEVDGQKVTMYEIKVEKLVDSPLRILAWQYAANDVDFVVQIRILEDYYEDYQRTFDAVLKSFRRIPRTQAMPSGAAEGKKITLGSDEANLTPEQRAERRKKEVEDTLAKEIAALPAGWTNVRSEHYVALSHVDPKFTKETLDFAEAIRAYLDKTFSLGNEYVPPGIIRIFANVGEESAYGQGSGGILAMLFGGAEQIAVTKKSGEDKDSEYEWLAKRVTGQWLSFRNRTLSRSMPFWIRQGLQYHMSFARPAGGKRIEFKPDPREVDALRELFKKGEAIPLKDLFQGDDERFKEHSHLLEAGRVVGWLLGDGGKGKLKNSVQAYLKELIAAVDETQKEIKAKRDAAKGKDGPSADSGPKTEEEESAQLLAEQKEYESKRNALRERAFKAAFGAMDDKDWKTLDAAFAKFAG
jgi:hypothetical protein